MRRWKTTQNVGKGGEEKGEDLNWISSPSRRKTTRGWLRLERGREKCAERREKGSNRTKQSWSLKQKNFSFRSLACSLAMPHCLHTTEGKVFRFFFSFSVRRFHPYRAVVPACEISWRVNCWYCFFKVLDCCSNKQISGGKAKRAGEKLNFFSHRWWWRMNRCDEGGSAREWCLEFVVILVRVSVSIHQTNFCLLRAELAPRSLSTRQRGETLIFSPHCLLSPRLLKRLLAARSTRNLETFVRENFIHA